MRRGPVSARWLLRSVNAVLRPLGFHVAGCRPDHDSTAALVRSLRRTAATNIQHRLGPCVVSGPFQGLRLSDPDGWNAPDLGALLLGCYEEQLHPAVEQIVSAQPDVVVNIGCAEGYYAVGIARRCVGTHVFGVDTDEQARQRLERSAEINDVGDRVEFRSSLPLVDFDEILDRAIRPAVVVDCEGAEIHYVDPTLVPSLARAMLLVELHEFIVPGVATRIAPSPRAFASCRGNCGDGSRPSPTPGTSRPRKCRTVPGCVRGSSCDDVVALGLAPKPRERTGR